MSAPESGWIEVAYALPDRQTVVRVDMAPDMTAMDAIVACGVLDAHPELRGRELEVGIFGRPVPLTEALHHGDRVEIYRPLRADPRETRRRLAAEGRTMGAEPSGRGRG